MRKFAVIFLLLVSLVFVAAFWVAAVRGRGIVLAELERVTGKNISLGVVYPTLSAGLVFRDLRIEGLAKMPSAQVRVRLRSLLAGRLEIASIELQSPEVNIRLAAPATSEDPQTASQVIAPVPASLAVKRAPLVDRFIVRDGTLMLQAPTTGKTWIFEKVHLDLQNLALDGVLSSRTDFVLESSLARLNIPFVGHLAKARGWVNWAARDMDAGIEVVDDDGRTGLSATVTSRANVCEVKGRALMLSSQQAQSTGKKPQMLETAVLDLLRSSQTDLDVDFSFQTPLDHFEVGKVNIAGNITTGLQTDEISGNIVGSLKAAGAKLLEKESVSTVKPYKF